MVELLSIISVENNKKERIQLKTTRKKKTKIKFQKKQKIIAKKEEMCHNISCEQGILDIR